MTIVGKIRGSSPLARGLRVQRRHQVSGSGIIPARAGFTWRRRPRSDGSADHPRSRGVYPGPGTTAVPGPGSSPLARGLPRHLRPTRHHERIIPARAGFTTSARARSLTCRDHPRSRGVYLSADGAWLVGCGSSPLARGLPRPGRRSGPGVSDHPRSRGVYGTANASETSMVGSSPLARGLRAIACLVYACAGIIPARAGFTLI